LALVSRDGGYSYKYMYNTKILGAYFFVSNNRRVHSRVAFDTFDLLAKVGGLFSLTRITFSFFAKLINMEAMVMSIAEKTFYTSKNGKRHEALKMNCCEWLSYPFMCCFELSKRQTRFKAAVNNSRSDLDIVNLLLTLRKMKAGLSALVGNDL
jgi:hypothetical protein